MNPNRWMSIRLTGHGTSVAVPEGMFAEIKNRNSTQEASTWIATDGSEISLWSELKPLGASLESLLKRESATVEMVTLSEIESDSIVLEGFDSDWFVHRRIKLGVSGRLHGVEMRYPFKRKPEYETIAANVCASLGGE